MTRFSILVGLLLGNYYCSSQPYFLSSFHKGQKFYPYDFVESSNGEFILPGKWVGGFNDVGMFIRTDSQGVMINQREYYSDLTNNRGIGLYSIENNAGNTFLAAGYTGFTTNLLDNLPALFKLNPDGSIVWAKVLLNSYLNSFRSIRKTPDGNYALLLNSSGVSLKKIFLVKADSGGNVMRSVKLSCSAPMVHLEETMFSSTNDNGLIITGTVSDSTAEYGMITRTDSLFNPVWSLYFSKNLFIQKVIQTSDGGFLTMADSVSSAASPLIIFKLDSAGSLEWTTSIYDSLRAFYEGTLIENSDHSFFCNALWLKVNPTYLNYACLISHIDSSGNPVSFLDTLNIQHYRDTKRTSDNRYCSLVALGTSSGYASTLFVTDTLFGHIPCLDFDNTTLGFTHTPIPIFPLTVTSANATYTFQDTVVIDTSLYAPIPTYCTWFTSANEIEQDNSFSIYPNPAARYLTLMLGNNRKKAEVNITDITGRIVYTRTLTETQEVEITLNGFADGIYVVHVQTNDFIEIKRLIIAK